MRVRFPALLAGVLAAWISSACGRTPLSEDGEEGPPGSDASVPDSNTCVAGLDGTGICCSVSRGSPNRVPSSETVQVVIDPAFACREFVCASQPGDRAYCTKVCSTAKDCPKGFGCEVSNGPSLPGTKFCIAESCIACPRLGR